MLEQGPVVRARPPAAATGLFADSRLRVPAALFLLCLAAQLYLVWFKSFNWDEFLHFSQVYQARAGTLTQTFQVLHARLLWWAPDAAGDLIGQMRAARLVIWGASLLTLAMIFGVARRFASAPDAFFAAFAYLGAGFVFQHAFAIRADPLVTAALMSALFLLVETPLGPARAIAIGALLGLAEMITIKALFYAPCFAGLAYLQWRQAASKLRLLVRFGLIAVAALVTFAAIYQLHTTDLVAVAQGGKRGPALHSGYLRWITIDLPFAGYILQAMILGPVFFTLAVVAPTSWKQSGLNRDERLALAAFLAPLLVLFFYRNTFPYFFVFLLAPIAVAIAPALGWARKRYGAVPLALLLTAGPLLLALQEPRSVIDDQSAMIDYVHREFPEPTGYLDYSGMISD